MKILLQFYPANYMIKSEGKLIDSRVKDNS